VFVFLATVLRLHIIRAVWQIGSPANQSINRSGLGSNCSGATYELTQSPSQEIDGFHKKVSHPMSRPSCYCKLYYSKYSDHCRGLTIIGFITYALVHHLK